jgi:hypothetical protein
MAFSHGIIIVEKEVKIPGMSRSTLFVHGTMELGLWPWIQSVIVSPIASVSTAAFDRYPKGGDLSRVRQEGQGVVTGFHHGRNRSKSVH